MGTRFAALIVLPTFLALLLLVASPAVADVDISMVGYRTPDGSFQPTEDGGTIPLGSTLNIRVWADLYSCDPVTVDWDDGTVESISYGGTFAVNWYHTYNATGTYRILATDACSSVWNVAWITVGGVGLAIFDPSSDYFVPTLFGLGTGLAAVGSAIARPRGLQGPGVAQGAPPGDVHQPTEPRARSRLRPGALPSMAMNLVSYRDIPIGAPRQNPDPRIPIIPGQQTDLLTGVTGTCGHPLGYVAGGWFCLDPACPLIQPRGAEPWPRIVHEL